MKKALLLAAMGLMLLTGCWQPKQNIVLVPCNVDPDTVFGRHYTAADFGIWNIEDFGTGRYGKLVGDAMHRLPRKMWRDYDSQNGLMLPAADTAVYGLALRQRDGFVIADGAGLIAYHWLPIQHEGDTVFQLNFVYGNTLDHALIDGRRIKKAYVERWAGREDLSWQFDREGTRMFRELTAARIGYRLAFMLGDSLISAPKVMAEISGGRCSLSGISTDEACALVAILNRQER